MGKILTKLTILLVWVYYAALIYTAYNPAHGYMNYLENANTFYLILHVPLNILFGPLVLFAATNKQTVMKQIREDLQKKEEGERQKILDSIKKMNSVKFKITTFIGTILVLGAMLSSFIILGYPFLGTTMLMGFLVAKKLTSLVEDMDKEIANV